MKVKHYDLTGKELSDISIESDLFDREVNTQLLSQYVHVHRQRRALGTKKTKGRGEVAGGGRKPWRQKGTGRARHGSIRSPLWVGGGHHHHIEPKPDRRVRMSKKMRRAALASALSLLARNEAISVLEVKDFDAPKTKTIGMFLEERGLADKKVLFVTKEKDVVLEKSASNISRATVTEVRLLNPHTILEHEHVVFVGDAYNMTEGKNNE